MTVLVFDLNGMIKCVKCFQSVFSKDLTTSNNSSSILNQQEESSKYSLIVLNSTVVTLAPKSINLIFMRFYQVVPHLFGHFEPGLLQTEDGAAIEG